MGRAGFCFALWVASLLADACLGVRWLCWGMRVRRWLYRRQVWLERRIDRGRSPPCARMGYPQYGVVVSAGASAYSITALAALCFDRLWWLPGRVVRALVPYVLAVS